MPNSSPYDMISKARRYAAAADRWAVLKANTHDRTPLNPSNQQGAEPQTVPTPHAPYQTAPPPELANPPLMQPPFPPPQPRHPYMDEIVQRHEQAWKSATPLQAWTPEPLPQGAWREPAPTTAKAAPNERPTPNGQPASPEKPAPSAQNRRSEAEIASPSAVPEPWMEA